VSVETWSSRATAFLRSPSSSCYPQTADNRWTRLDYLTDMKKTRDRISISISIGIIDSTSTSTSTSISDNSVNDSVSGFVEGLWGKRGSNEQQELKTRRWETKTSGWGPTEEKKIEGKARVLFRTLSIRPPAAQPLSFAPLSQATWPWREVLGRPECPKKAPRVLPSVPLPLLLRYRPLHPAFA